MSGYSSDRVGVEQHYVPTRVSPTHNSPSSRNNRGYKENKTQTGREASWQKQVRKVKRVGKSEKWVTTPRGGRSKKQFVGKKTKTIGGRVKGAKRGSKKDLITYVDKPTRYVGLG